MVGRPPALFDDRYATEPNSGCWLWLGARDRDGYGRLWVRAKGLLAHRYSYRLHIGEIPAGMCVCHKCDMPCCVNPDHLFLDTNPGNTADKVRKGRQAKGPLMHSGRNTARGSRSGKAVLNELLVAEAKRMRKDGAAVMSISRHLGCSYGALLQALNGKTWAHVC